MQRYDFFRIFATLIRKNMVYKYDFLVIGAGVAGMSYALKVAREKKGTVCIICKAGLDEASTNTSKTR